MKLKKFWTYSLIILTALTFIFVTVLVIIISLGGKITTDGIKTTGTIRLQILPENAEIKAFLNGEEANLNGKYIYNLLEGEYILEIKSEKFHNWQKKVSVKNKIVLDVFINLYPIDIKYSKFSDIPISNFTSDEGNEFIYFTEWDDIRSNMSIQRVRLNEQTFLLIEQDKKRELMAQISAKSLNFNNDSDIILLPSLDNQKILLLIPDQKAIYTIDKSNGIESELTAKLNFYPDSVKWIKSSDSVLIEKGNNLFRHEIRTGITTLLYFSETEKPIYVIKDGEVIIYDLKKEGFFIIGDGANQKLQNSVAFDNISKIYSGNNKDGIFLIESKSNTFTLFISDTQQIFNLDISNSQLYDYSNNNSIFVFKNGNSYITLNIEEIVAIGRYEIQITTHKEINSDLNSLKMSSGKHIINKSEKSLSLIESDGSNDVLILDKLEGKIGEVFMANDQKFIFFSYNPVTNLDDYYLYYVKIY